MVCLPKKKEGGLGVLNLRTQNEALLLNISTNFSTDQIHLGSISWEKNYNNGDLPQPRKKFLLVERYPKTLEFFHRTSNGKYLRWSNLSLLGRPLVAESPQSSHSRTLLICQRPYNLPQICNGGS